MRKLSDLRFPGEWFPEARQMQRKIILHVGPTNSGKTYRALKRLEEAESGIYCGPLRLLAHEVFEKMNAKGITCNLLTGEEKRVMDEACLMTSSTVEMANLGRRMEVAVIDEIQMIGDPLRGWAWTQALLGLKAKEIHLCGEPAAVPLIKSICESLNEEVVVNEYERLTPVTINEASLNRNWTKIRKGDCVVAFSRSQIFEIKTKIEKETGLKCAVAYGALPPETRAMQARSFNDPESDVNVLVASDAVGMGLNLNIKRIIFSTVKKFDGHANRYMSIPQLKQIAGRAGRFGTTYANGQVTTMYPQDLNYVKMAMKAPIHYLKLAGLQPTVDMLEFFAVQMPQESFPNLLQKFEEMASVESSYFLCNFGDQKKIAEAINHVDLNLRDRYIISTAPVSTRNEQLLDTVARFAEMHSHSDTCTLDTVVTLPKQPPREPKSLQELELAHKTIMLYMWLA
ncbi:P-loop containing nucleoside triphosphate hydrolase protein [Radiomyces spectabilis]|uniref:P-loop containing nucleoside triphosphate hydrolase protein n=1 Tax=Radiomyces spectabilis TaxID=64574 RepID=UPI0022203790|nr:P-loop containing nucleoside triphosphate hydrolase protein [Radiomyces spectabilis]KAI8394309.1 P-loop containing nucleoside triphosphate hydrolase protein [Radiomyces spectabilis]